MTVLEAFDLKEKEILRSLRSMRGLLEMVYKEPTFEVTDDGEILEKDVSTKLYNLLKKVDMLHVDKIKVHRLSNLRKIRGLGTMTLLELEKFLQSKGINLQ